MDMGGIAKTWGVIAITVTFGLVLTGGAATAASVSVAVPPAAPGAVAGVVAGTQRGPAPTSTSIQATQGSFKTTSVAAQNVTGFGSGTIDYPTDTSQGPVKSGGLTSGSLKAAIAIAPWENTKNFSKDTVPTMIIAGSSDIVASPADHAKKFYSSIPGAKAYVELNGKDHFFTTSANAPQAEMMIAWLKVNVDDDTRYAQFLCPGPAVGATFSGYQATCPNL
jgi:pimeloyl-ACP methyl ester carboxylesterase